MMTEAEAIVNKALETDAVARPRPALPENTDDPEQYIDWAGQKAEIGGLTEIRFGAHIHTTDEDVLSQNASDNGIDINNPSSIGDQLARDYGLIERNVIKLLADIGLVVSDEGHYSSGARTCSIWIRDDVSTAHNGEFGQGLLKRILDAADTDWPATSTGNFDSFFPSGTEKAYEGVSDYGKQLIDVTVEFTGVDALKEWAAVNIIESKEGIDVDSSDANLDPKEYLDAATGWIDVFLAHGMTPDLEHSHDSQFFKSYKLPGLFEKDAFTLTVRVHVKNPMWIVTTRTHSRSGITGNYLTFQFQAGDRKGLSSTFIEIDNVILSAVTAPDASAGALDYRLMEVFKKHSRRHQRRLDGFAESVDDPEIQHYIDQTSAEACRHCNNDLTKRHTVVRQYIERDTGIVHELSGHYGAEDGYFKNEEPFSAALLAVIYKCDLPDDCDICQRCGKSTTSSLDKPTRQESVDDPDINHFTEPHLHRDAIHAVIEDCGLHANEVQVWGRWIVFNGFAVWAVDEIEKPLPPEFFRTRVEEQMDKIGIKDYRLRFTSLKPIYFSLAVPKLNLEWESWFEKSVSHDPAVQKNSEWLPESVDDADLNHFLDRNPDVGQDDYVLVCKNRVAPGAVYPNGQPVPEKLHFLSGAKKKGAFHNRGARYPFSGKRGAAYFPAEQQKLVDHYTHADALKMIQNVQKDDWTRTHFHDFRARPYAFFTQALKHGKDVVDESIDDEPTPASVEHFTQHIEHTAQEAVASAIANATLEFDAAMDATTVRGDCQHADDLAQLYARKWIDTAGYATDSPEASIIRAALFKRASERVPDKEYAQESADDEGNPECYLKAVPMRIKATIYSDGFNAEGNRGSLDFDAAEWFQQADLEELIALAAQACCRSYEADNVAEFFADKTPEMRLFFDNLHSGHYGQPAGFEVYIDEEDAKNWIECNRPGCYRQIWSANGVPTAFKVNAFKVKVRESVDDVEPQAFIDHVFDIPALMKRLHYEDDTDGWSKYIRNVKMDGNERPTDVCIYVRRRGHGNTTDDGQTKYDLEFSYSLHGSGGSSIARYRYSLTNHNLERTLLQVEKELRAGNSNFQFVESVVPEPVPDVDDPTEVLSVHAQGTALAEFTRLDFKPYPGQFTVPFYNGENIRCKWFKPYKATDGTNHGIYIELGGPVAVKSNSTPPEWNVPHPAWIRNYDWRSRAWSAKKSTAYPKNITYFTVLLRDLDAAMTQAAADSLTMDQEARLLDNVVAHHNAWHKTL